MKNKEFVVTEILMFIAICCISLGIVLPIIHYKSTHNNIPKPTQALEDVQSDVDVIVKVQGYYENWPYIIFEDRYTHTRILYYRGAMTYLKQKNEN
jgi:hypothetical protein